MLCSGEVRTQQYGWIDTCRIDKKSSAELSEAIKSMYHWYQNSETCYVYLSDFSVDDQCGTLLGRLAKSRWFYRGWTLQELLAPRLVVLYDRDWESIGDKWHLSDHISPIIGIQNLYVRI